MAGPRGATSAPVAADAHRWRRMSTHARELPGEAKTSRCADPRVRRGAESAEYGRDNVIEVRSPPQSRTRNRPRGAPPQGPVVMPGHSLSLLSDQELLRDLAVLVARDRTTTAALLAHLAEVDARRLYLPAAYPSMYLYCVCELG